MWGQGCGEGEVARSHAVRLSGLAWTARRRERWAKEGRVWRALTREEPIFKPVDEGRKKSGVQSRKRSRPSCISASPKWTLGRSDFRRIETARELEVRRLGACTWSIIMMDTGWARIASGPFKSDSQRARVRCPQIGPQQLTRAMSATRPAGGTGPAAS